MKVTFNNIHHGTEISLLDHKYIDGDEVQIEVQADGRETWFSFGGDLVELDEFIKVLSIMRNKLWEHLHGEKE